MGKAERSGLFLFFHKVHEFAPPAVMQFLSEGSLNLAAAERTDYCPAGSSGIFSFMDSVKRLQGRHGADAEFRCFMSARLTTALLVFPAIHLFHAISANPFFCLVDVAFLIPVAQTHHKYLSFSFRKKELLKAFPPEGFYT